MTAATYEYALLRVIPRVDRGESINAGVVLYCQGLDFLGARTALDAGRLRALDAGVDPDAVRAALAAVVAVCDGDPAVGPAGTGALGTRFRWLTAPKSTIVQPGPVHGGLTTDPAAQLEHLVDALVR
ncbi:MAG TPA: DUF3037 domain-containing protein [Mycobacteriales bacterium]|jgi:hypothetical protein|nr:hypothetical protein [Cryptosporangiaceae bacterium]MDQ1678489.1 hypothetical protein [Actinomycetota bacterium]HEV7755300.1 DUF3037 domain-containing protein [Mycobacteriales bacterium]